jgi:hypothetical protein
MNFLISYGMDIEEARQISDKYLGMRCKVDKDGCIVLYANFWTLIVDCFKSLKMLIWKREG